jgi:hypothetical protein
MFHSDTDVIIKITKYFITDLEPEVLREPDNLRVIESTYCDYIPIALPEEFDTTGGKEYIFLELFGHRELVTSFNLKEEKEKYNYFINFLKKNGIKYEEYFIKKNERKIETKEEIDKNNDNKIKKGGSMNFGNIIIAVRGENLLGYNFVECTKEGVILYSKKEEKKLFFGSLSGFTDTFVASFDGPLDCEYIISLLDDNEIKYDYFEKYSWDSDENEDDDEEDWENCCEDENEDDEETNNKGDMMSKIKKVKERAIEVNKEGTKTALSLQAGETGINFVLNRLKKSKKIPKQYVDNFVAPLVIANIMDLAITSTMPENEKAKVIGQAMVNFGVLEFMKHFDIPGLVNGIIDEIGADKVEKLTKK